MNAQVGISSNVARRYARALFELARERGALDAVAADMRALLRVVDEVPGFARFLKSPLPDARAQTSAMRAILETLDAHELSRGLATVLVRNRRLALLDEVARAWLALLARDRGEVRVRAITAEPLGEAQARALREALGEGVVVDNDVDPSIIGGLVLRVGSRMIDASVKHRLTALKGMLKGV